jgi:hypothetical protein
MRNYWRYERQAGAKSASRAALAANHWPMFPGVNARVYLNAAAGGSD